MLNIKPRVIIGNSSIFLDALRIGAALTVLYIHAFDRWFPKFAHPHDDAGRTVSCGRGYLLRIIGLCDSAYHHQPEPRCCYVCPGAFKQAMLYRYTGTGDHGCYSFIVKQVNPQLLAAFRAGTIGCGILPQGLFVNELWLFSAAPPLNGSLWSLSFEFWYYAIFGLWFFRKGGWKSFLLPVLPLY
jgi:peptidoglycan/LPS O-acetylase OafA/YrhL